MLAMLLPRSQQHHCMLLVTDSCTAAVGVHPEDDQHRHQPEAAVPAPGLPINDGRR